MVSLTIQGPTLNTTEYMQVVSNIAANASCGTCLPNTGAVYTCDRCQITVNVTYSQARRLLATNAVLDTSITATDLPTAQYIAIKLNTTQAKQDIKASLGGSVVFVQAPQIIIINTPIQIPPTPKPTTESSNSTLLLVVVCLVGAVLVVGVGVVAYLLSTPTTTVIIHNKVGNDFPDRPGQLLGRKILNIKIKEARPPHRLIHRI